MDAALISILESLSTKYRKENLKFRYMTARVNDSKGNDSKVALGCSDFMKFLDMVRPYIDLSKLTEYGNCRMILYFFKVSIGSI